MKKTRHQDLQRQITSLIPIVEMHISLIEEIEASKNKLDALPIQLNKMKQKLELSKLESDFGIAGELPSPDRETELDLDFLVDDLEGILIHLTSLNRQVKNVIASKERLEAVQKDRIAGFTPERFYKILRRRHQLSSEFLNYTPSTKTNYLQSRWRKIANYKFGKRLIITTASISGIILLFSTISYSTINQQLNEGETITEIE